MWNMYTDVKVEKVNENKDSNEERQSFDSRNCVQEVDGYFLF